MSTHSDDTTAVLNRINDLFTWWRIPNASQNSDARVKQVQAFTSELQKIYSDALGEQLTAARTTNERIANVIQEFPRCRQPQDVIATQASLFSLVGEGISLQAKAWVELMQKVQGCYAMATRDMVDELRAHSAEPVPPGSTTAGDVRKS